MWATFKAAALRPDGVSALTTCTLALVLFAFNLFYGESALFYGPGPIASYISTVVLLAQLVPSFGCMVCPWPETPQSRAVPAVAAFAAIGISVPLALLAVAPVTAYEGADAQRLSAMGPRFIRSVAACALVAESFAVFLACRYIYCEPKELQQLHKRNAQASYLHAVAAAVFCLAYVPIGIAAATGVLPVASFAFLLDIGDFIGTLASAAQLPMLLFQVLLLARAP